MNAVFDVFRVSTDFLLTLDVWILLPVFTRTALAIVGGDIRSPPCESRELGREDEQFLILEKPPCPMLRVA